MALVVASPAPLARSQDDAANRLLDQAAALYEQGSRRESLDKYREALDLLGKSRDRESLLVCCSNASVVAANLGEYEVSYSMASRALGIAVDLGDLEGQAKSLNNLGLAAQFLGRNNEARSRYCGALALNRERRDIESVVTNLGNIGVIEFNSGRLAEALSIYRRALALAREYASEPWAVGQRRIATANLGAVMEKVGESSLALEMYESLLRDPDLPLDQAASLHTSLGRVFLQLEDPGQALSCFEIASNEFESLGDAGGQSNVALHIGATLCQRLKRHGEAQASFGKALEIATRIRDRNEELFDLLFLGKCLLHTGDVALAVSRLHEALSVAQECGSLEGRWSAMFGLGKAAEVSGRPIDALKHHLEGLALVERERESHVPDAFRAGFLADKEESCAAAVRLTLGGGAGPTTPSERMVHAFGIVERFRARSLLDRLEAAPLSLDDVRAAIDDPREALVEFVSCGETIFAFLVEGDETRLVELAVGRDLARTVASAIVVLAHPNRHIDGMPLELLTKAVIEPIVRVLPARITRLVVVADGPLHSLPFAALRVDGTANSPRLVERFAISFTPSASCWVALRRRKSRAFSLDLAAFADPVIAARGATSVSPETSTPIELLTARHGLKPLPHSADEARQVAAEVPGGSEIKTGRDCTTSEFFRVACRGPRVLHLATHTVIDDDAASGPLIMFTPANDASDVGMLRPADVARHSVRSDVVVLSSCESGRGRVLQGEGVLSLSRAFLEAGSRCVVGTLWAVDDAFSPVFMQHFYAALGRGISASEALQSAQIDCIRSDRANDPSLWAGYVVVGDATAPVWPRSIARRLVTAILAGLLVVGTGAVLTSLLRRRRIVGPATRAARPTPE